MSSLSRVVFHASQFPESVQHDLLESLRTRRVNHKFHYDSVQQTQKWLAVHQAYSPTRNDENCREIYDGSFAAAAKKIKSKSVHVLGLGCGGGQKDTKLLGLLKAGGKEIFYTPCDVSAAMVLVARKTALAVLPEKNCFPFVCDLATANDLPAVFAKQNPPDTVRLVTFFGMIPNFEPQMILPKLALLVRPQDYLLFSANLAPGKNYTAGVKKVLPQYDNALTRDWLITFLLNLGVERRDGELHFKIKGGVGGWKRIVAGFQFTRSRRIEIERERFEFRRGESVQLFFSYRYPPALVRRLLGQHGLAVSDEWITKAETEGVFLCRRK